MSFFALKRAGFLVVCALAVFALNGTAGADPKDAAIESVDEKPQIPDQYIQEARTFYNKCTARPKYFHYRDCECWAKAHLNERIDLGPEAPQDQILVNIRGECKDATEAAGYYYDRCLGQGGLLMEDQDPEKFCSCFGNIYAKLFEAYDIKTSSKAYVDLQTQAMITCNDPELANRFYPFSIVK